MAGADRSGHIEKFKMALAGLKTADGAD